MVTSRVLVVGAGAIGVAIAARYAGAGARVAVVDVDSSALARARAEVPALAEATPVDLLASDATARLVEVVERLGGVDVVAFTAGASWCGDLLDADAAAFLDLLRVSVLGLQRVARAVADSLAERGGLLAVVAGADARAPDRFLELWGVSSACLHALARCIAVELAGRRARTVVLGVAGVEGGGLDEVEHLVGEAVGDEALAKRLLAKRRIAPPPSATDVANALAALDAAPLFGATLFLDGGGAATMP